MPPTISCPSCGARIRVPESPCPEVARCPRCKEPVRLRAPSNDVSPVRPRPPSRRHPAAAVPVKKAPGLSAWWLLALALAVTVGAGAAGLVLVAAAYRSPNGLPPVVQALAPVARPAPAPPPAEFNPVDVQETLRWLEDQVKDTPPASGNEVRDKEVVDGVEARMKWLKGKHVSWTFEVEKISDSAVSFRPARRAGPGKAATIVEALLSRPGGEGFGEFSLGGLLGASGNNEYPFAAGEDKHWAAALNSGDPLTVTGEVSWVGFFNHSPDRTFAFRLKNATATGQRAGAR